MNIKSNQPKSPAEQVVKDIRRATRLQKFHLRAILKRWWAVTYVNVNLRLPNFSIRVSNLSPGFSQTCLSLG